MSADAARTCLEKIRARTGMFTAQQFAQMWRKEARATRAGDCNAMGVLGTVCAVTSASAHHLAATASLGIDASVR